MAEGLGCTLDCACQRFRPGKMQPRQCEQCGHGWVAHALSKLRTPPAYPTSQVEAVRPSVVFDIGSLVLYGTQAIPVRLKILLDRLFGALPPAEVLRILRALDWTLQDYVRGYVLQDASGKVLERWSVMSGEEEAAALQQFLRFGETKPIVELMAAQDQEEPPLLLTPAAASIDIRAFLESCSQRGAGLPGPGTRGSAAHPFENLVNNMAFLLPFQLLNPVPPALIGALPEPYLLEQAPAPQPRPEARAPFLEDHPALPRSPRGRAEKEPSQGCPETVPKREGGTPVGDPGPYPVVTRMERAQLSPEAKAKPERGGLGTRKGRVFCSACEKTFYDKGTLKIHYNAVHLKIKHKCTVQGCNMVFSSLRSRNRHSANPNPRLHAPANRNSRDKDLRLGLGLAAPAPSPAHPGTPPARPSLGHHGVLFPTLRTVQPVLPFYRSPATPAELALTPGVLPSLPLLSSSIPEQLASTAMPFDPLPKKKSRKSSMPIKIEKEAAELAPEKRLSLEEEPPLHGAGEEEPGPRSPGSDGAPPAGVQPGVALSEARRPGHGGSGLESRGVLGHTPEPATCPSERDAERKPGRTGAPGDSEDGGLGRAARSTEPCVRLPRRVLTAGPFGGLAPGELALPRLEDPEARGLAGQQGLSRREGASRFQCGACKKTSEDAGGAKLHHKDRHAREAHACAAGGCGAAFPARRSRDRHSSNPKHHPSPPRPPAWGSSSDGAPAAHLPKDAAPTQPQASVIFQGASWTGLLYPVATVRGVGPEGQATGPAGEGAVLDLSAAPSGKSEDSSRSSADSDRASEDGRAPPGDGEGPCGGHSPAPPGEEHPLCVLMDTAALSLARPLAGPPAPCRLCQAGCGGRGAFQGPCKAAQLRRPHKCGVPSCGALFSSTRSRNRHSQNPNLHRGLAAPPSAAQ